MARINFLLLAILVASSLALVTAQHRAGRLAGDLERERAIAQALNSEWKQLQLEASTRVAPALIEKAAVDRLRMRLPGVRRTLLVPAGDPAQASAPPAVAELNAESTVRGARR